MKNKKVWIWIGIAVLVFVVAGIYVEKRGRIDSGLKKTERVVAPVFKNMVNFGDYGKAPDFVGIDNWLNSKPLHISDLKGKVVLVDFWTFSCINCIRTLPYVTKWYDTYHDQGFVVIGVHTPEFAFEKEKKNVEEAMINFGIHYPVAQDNEYQTWNAYNNQYWPAEYLINQDGEIIYEHFGEGNYDKTENAIKQLLGMNPDQAAKTQDDLEKIGSPEMYFGTARLANLTKSQIPSLVAKEYSLNPDVHLNEFSLGGTWEFTPQNIKLLSQEGKIALTFHSGKVFLVASSSNQNQPAILSITVDGQEQPSISVKDSKLYTLYSSDDYSDHEILITIDGPGFEAFTFTFG